MTIMLASSRWMMPDERQALFHPSLPIPEGAVA